MLQRLPAGTGAAVVSENHLMVAVQQPQPQLQPMVTNK